MFLQVLLFVGAALMLAGWIWLIKQAFEESTAWGLVVLLVPVFGAIFFTVAMWDEARGPFAVQASGFVIAAVAVMLLVQSGFSVGSDSLADQSLDGATVIDDGLEFESEPPPPPPSRTTAIERKTRVHEFVKKKSARDREVTVSANAAGSYLDRDVKVIKKSGNIIRGRLLSTDSEAVIVSRFFGAGRMDITIPHAEIDHLIVVR